MLQVSMPMAGLRFRSLEKFDRFAELQQAQKEQSKQNSQELKIENAYAELSKTILLDTTVDTERFIFTGIDVLNGLSDLTSRTHFSTTNKAAAIAEAEDDAYEAIIQKLPVEVHNATEKLIKTLLNNDQYFAISDWPGGKHFGTTALANDVLRRAQQKLNTQA